MTLFLRCIIFLSFDWIIFVRLIYFTKASAIFHLRRPLHCWYSFRCEWASNRHIIYILWDQIDQYETTIHSRWVALCSFHLCLKQYKPLYKKFIMKISIYSNDIFLHTQRETNHEIPTVAKNFENCFRSPFAICCLSLFIFKTFDFKCIISPVSAKTNISLSPVVMSG